MAAARDEGLAAGVRRARELRLLRIRETHLSSGAVLDSRTLFPLQEVKKGGSGFRNASKASPRQQSQFAQAEETNPSKTTAAVSQQQQQQHHEYEVEELLWSVKSKSQRYTLERMAFAPELVELEEVVRRQSSNEFEHHRKEQICKLANGIREEVRQMKQEMDKRAVFHPDANAERAFSQFLTKFYRSVNADQVEHAALRKIASQHVSAQKHLAKLSTMWAAQINGSPGHRDLESAIDKVNASDDSSSKHHRAQAVPESRRRVQSATSLSTAAPSKISSRSTRTKDVIHHDGWKHVPEIVSTVATAERPAQALEFSEFQQQLKNSAQAAAVVETARRSSFCSIRSVDASTQPEKRGGNNSASAIALLAQSDPAFKRYMQTAGTSGDPTTTQPTARNKNAHIKPSNSFTALIGADVLTHPPHRTMSRHRSTPAMSEFRNFLRPGIKCESDEADTSLVQHQNHQEREHTTEMDDIGSESEYNDTVASQPHSIRSEKNECNVDSSGKKGFSPAQAPRAGLRHARSWMKRANTTGKFVEEATVSRILRTFDLLELNAPSRLAWLQKYSSIAYVREFPRAVQLWEDAAVLLVTLEELEHLQSCLEHRHAVTDALISRCITQDAFACMKRRNAPCAKSCSSHQELSNFLEVFSSSPKTANTPSREWVDAERQLGCLVDELSKLASDVVQQAQDELYDTISFKGKDAANFVRSKTC